LRSKEKERGEFSSMERRGREMRRREKGQIVPYRGGKRREIRAAGRLKGKTA